MAFVLRRVPQPLMDAMQGRVPADVYRAVREELGRRTAAQLVDRIERRWFGRWAHALRAKDEDGRPAWSADDIAHWLLAPSQCPVPDCEDGILLSTDLTCQQCTVPEYRFVPAAGTIANDRTRSKALSAMRENLRNSPYRTGVSTAGHAHVRRKPANLSVIDQALERARARLADPTAPRLTEPPPREEPGAEDSIILAARAARIAEEQDPTRQAALRRARAERSRRPS